MNDAFVVSVEVDGRQAYLLETDRLREMLGASRLVQRTVLEAERLFTVDDGLHMFSPVSGEIRAWVLATKRGLLLERTWQLREWLHGQGIEHTVGIMPASARDFREFAATVELDGKTRREDRNRANLARVHANVGALVASLKGRKPGVDARPTCSLFAPCQIHGSEPATTWRVGATAGSQDKRRDLTGIRAQRKLDEWEERKGDLFRAELLNPAAGVGRAVATAGLDAHRAIQLDDLSDAEADSSGDQFIAFICADGDGMGRVLTSIDWNHPDLEAVDNEPWRVNQRFARAFDGVVHEAYAQAVKQLLEKHFTKFEREARDSGSSAVRLPLLPQLLGGDDLWTVCRKRYALEFCQLFGAAFQFLVASSDVIKKVAESANRRVDELTISLGVAFAKSGHPAHAMLQSAESLLREAKERRKAPGTAEGCLDWHWIDSSLSQSVKEARVAGWRVKDGDDLYHLTTRPWTLSEAGQFVEAATAFSRGLHPVPRRKREQLDDILRRGALSGLAWSAWLKSLDRHELQTLNDVLALLPKLPGLDGISLDSPWSKATVATSTSPSARMTPWLDLLALDDVLGRGSDTQRDPVTP